MAQNKTPKHALPDDVVAKLTALRAPMAHALKWKVQTIIKPRPYDKEKRFALMVAYLDARDVQERLDNVAGFDWSAQYNVLPNSSGKLLVVECELTVFGTTRRDVGSVDAADANAYKSAYSDALKRAAAHFGIGRFVYRLPLLEAEVDVWSSGGKEKGRPKRQAMKELAQVGAALMRGVSPPAVGMVKILSEAQREEIPGLEPDEVDSETETETETELDRTLTGREAAMLLGKVRNHGIDEALMLQIATQGFQREVTSLKDVLLSEQEALIEHARAYYREHLSPNQQAVN